MTVQRVSRNDLTQLSCETPNAPMQMGAVLRLAEPVDRDAIRTVVAQGLPRVRRLRQRLVATPLGLGRPIWVDDDGFDLCNHIVDRPLEDPGCQTTVMRVAAAAVVERLPRDRPLWAMILLTDSAGACQAVIVVLHHVLADGIGGLAALTELVDPNPGRRPPERFPTPAPSVDALLSDSVASRLQSLRSLRIAGRNLRTGVAELRGPRRTARTRARRPSPSSLNRPIGSRRALVTVRVDLADAKAAAHRHRATINDVLLTAVAGALHATLRRRGESPDRLVISVPVSARRDDESGHLGNQVGVIPVAVPMVGDPVHRLLLIAGSTETDASTVGRATSAMVLGFVFRALARLHAFQWFISHQRLVNTFVTNIRGPDAPFSLAGSRISDLIAISPISGNVTVAFAAVSYAGTLTVTGIADPDTFPELDILEAALHAELAVLTPPVRVKV